jgi:hypothetical protein
MEEFIKQNVHKLMLFKKIFTNKIATDFITKLCNRGDLIKMESELEKCILTGNSINDIEDRTSYIKNFIKNYKKILEENSGNNFSLQKQPEKDNKSKLNDLLNNTNLNQTKKNENFKLEKIQLEKNEKEKEKEQIKESTTNNNTVKFEQKFTMKKKFRPEKLEKELPTIHQIDYNNYKKKYNFEEHHYKNKLEPTNVVCFCMGTKHPIVANCLNCGRIQCLQEGEIDCIDCGLKLTQKNEFIKSLSLDSNLKKSYEHKEKLLKFQKEFYSKMNIIDDYTDWYDISNNTWISKDMRDLAKEKDEELDRVRDDPDYRININLETNEITKVYESIDDAKVRQDISDFFVDSIRGNNSNNPSSSKNNNGNKGSKAKSIYKDKVYTGIIDDNNNESNIKPNEGSVESCVGFTNRAAEAYKKFLKDNGLGYCKK